MKRPRPYWHASKARGRFCQTPEKDKEKCGDGLEIIDFFFLCLWSSIIFGITGIPSLLPIKIELQGGP